MTTAEYENVQVPTVETQKSVQKKKKVAHRKNISSWIIEDKMIHTTEIFGNLDNKNAVNNKKRSNENFEETNSIQVLSLSNFILTL